MAESRKSQALRHGDREPNLHTHRHVAVDAAEPRIRQEQANRAHSGAAESQAAIQFARV